jgi:ubiquinol oxidase
MVMAMSSSIEFSEALQVNVAIAKLPTKSGRSFSPTLTHHHQRSPSLPLMSPSVTSLNVTPNRGRSFARSPHGRSVAFALGASSSNTDLPASDEVLLEETAPLNGKSSTASSVVVKASAADDTETTPEGGTMDPTIYAFNKILIDTVYQLICLLYPVRGTDRDFTRFYVLETVARVPYFAYLSVLHLRETFGERYGTMSERMRTHYAEADNELHHLLIMESLGGNESPLDRFVAQAAAFVYYWYVVVLFSVNEPAAYHLSELIEDHAYETYDGFLSDHGPRLRTRPVPDIARKYYERDNPFLFDLFCTVKSAADPTVIPGGGASYVRRRPKLETLYDVFSNVRDDEREHWKTLCNLVQYNDMNAVDATRVSSTRPKPETVVAGDAPNGGGN